MPLPQQDLTKVDTQSLQYLESDKRLSHDEWSAVVAELARRPEVASGVGLAYAPLRDGAIPLTVASSPSVTAPFVPAPQLPATPWNRPLAIGLVGAAFVTVGPFAPIISIPLFGSITYFGNGRSDGVIMLALGIVAAVLTLFRLYRSVAVVGVAAGAMLGAFFFQLQSKMSEASSGGSDAAAISAMFSSAVQFQWGFIVLVIGAICLIVAGVYGWEESRAIRVL